MRQTCLRNIIDRVPDLIFFAVLSSVLVAGCSTTKIQSHEFNKGFQYQPGFPHVSLEAHGSITKQNEPFTTVSTEIIPSSLFTFRGSDSLRDRYIASFDIFYDIKCITDAEIQTITYHDTKGLIFRDEKTAESQKNIIFSKDFLLPTFGRYEITVTVTDKKSRQTTRRKTTIYIPLTNDQHASLADVFLKGSVDGNTYKPITTYNVTHDYREIKFESQVIGGAQAGSTIVRSRLLRLESDLEPADRLSANKYSVSVLERNGIDYNDTETIYHQKRIIESNKDSLTIYQVSMKVPDVGNYRFLLEATSPEDGETFRRSYDFGVRRAGFPYVKQPKDMAEALYYLMNNKEYKALNKITNADSLKQAIDHFWLSHIEDPDKAQKAIKLYYSRVEEANKYFSNYKAGWKTDRGMVYVLFGPPKYRSRFGDRIRWAYTTDQYDPRTTYFFDEARQKSQVFPFYLYLLDRSNASLRENEYLIVRKWLKGNVIP